MTKHLLAGVAAFAMMSGVAFAQTLPGADGSTSTTTRVAPTPDGGYRASTTKKHVDSYGREVKEKNTYKSGIEGSTETHTKTQADPYGGDTTTRSTTTVQH